MQVVGQCLLADVVECQECLVHWTIVGAEEVQVVLGGRETVHERLTPGLERLDSMTEKLADSLLTAPASGGPDGTWCGDVAANGAEHLANKAFRCPVGQANASAWSTDAQQLVGRLLLIWGEHDAERRQNNVIGAVAHGQILDISFLEANLKSLRFGTFASTLEQRRCVVHTTYSAQTPSPADAGVPPPT